MPISVLRKTNGRASLRVLCVCGLSNWAMMQQHSSESSRRSPNFLYSHSFRLSVSVRSLLWFVICQWVERVVLHVNTMNILTSTRFSVLSPFVSNFTIYFISIFVCRPSNALTLSATKTEKRRNFVRICILGEEKIFKIKWQQKQSSSSPFRRCHQNSRFHSIAFVAFVCRSNRIGFTCKRKQIQCEIHSMIEL